MVKSRPYVWKIEKLRNEEDAGFSAKKCTGKAARTDYGVCREKP